MINRNLCNDGLSSPKKRADEDDEIIGEKRGKSKRPKVVSPGRQKFETQFEKYMISKYVEDPLKEKPIEPEVKPIDVKFDTITKLAGSLNAKVRAK